MGSDMVKRRNIGPTTSQKTKEIAPDIYFYPQSTEEWPQGEVYFVKYEGSNIRAGTNSERSGQGPRRGGALKLFTDFSKTNPPSASSPWTSKSLSRISDDGDLLTVDDTQVVSSTLR